MFCPGHSWYLYNQRPFIYINIQEAELSSFLALECHLKCLFKTPFKNQVHSSFAVWNSTPSHDRLVPLTLSFLPLVSRTGQFRVIGPGRPIRALVGDEADLPCRISPGRNATGMEVGWYRPPFSRVVHLYRNGKDQDGEQAPEYRGRTELLKDTIGDGKVTLRIRSVRFSDEGGFTCFFRDHSYQEEAAMELKVEGEQSHNAGYLRWGVKPSP